MTGIILGILFFTGIVIMFRSVLNRIEMQHHLYQENNYKIYLKRAEQLAYVFLYNIHPTIFPNADLLMFETSSGVLYQKYYPEYGDCDPGCEIHKCSSYECECAWGM